MIRTFIILIVCAAIFSREQVYAAADTNQPPAVQPPEEAKVGQGTEAKAETPEEKEAAFAASIEKKAAGILALLNLKDETKARTIHDAVVSQYRFLHEWHATNDAKLKELNAKKTDDDAKAEADKIMATLKEPHAKFIAVLETNLTAEQIETVKDYIVWRKLPFTYKAYCDMLPNLTSEQKTNVYEILKQAREAAMDVDNPHKQTDLYQQWKGRKVNAYLKSQGIDLTKAWKDYNDRTRTANPAMRDFVLKNNPDDPTPATNRIFIEYNWKESAIVPFHEGMTLDDAIQQAKFKNEHMIITVRRADTPPYDYSMPAYDTADGKGIKSSKFILHRLDAIGLTDENTN